MEIAALFRSRGATIERALCSTALRARQTLEIVGGGLAAGAETIFAEALYDAAGDYIDFIRAHAGNARSVLVVGHNPAAQATALRLAEGAATAESVRLAQGFAPACLAMFEGEHPWSEFGVGSMRLTEFVAPSVS
jgi:phosphohistidine phosphatase